MLRDALLAHVLVIDGAMDDGAGPVRSGELAPQSQVLRLPVLEVNGENVVTLAYYRRIICPFVNPPFSFMRFPLSGGFQERKGLQGPVPTFTKGLTHSVMIS